MSSLFRYSPATIGASDKTAVSACTIEAKITASSAEIPLLFAFSNRSVFHQISLSLINLSIAPSALVSHHIS
jgi:hypothetical protein